MASLVILGIASTDVRSLPDPGLFYCPQVQVRTTFNDGLLMGIVAMQEGSSFELRIAEDDGTIDCDFPGALFVNEDFDG